MSNYRDGYFERGTPAGGVIGKVTLTADNQAVSIEGLAQLQISSDNTTAANRTFTLAPATLPGQKVTLIMESGSSTTCQLANSGTCKLAVAWEPVQYQALRLEWDGNFWIEEGRSNVSIASTALTDAHIFVGSGANVATDVAVTGDVTISNAGVTAIASDVIVNADVKTDAAIAFSKLATLASGNIIVGSAGAVPTSVAMAGDVTIIAAGTTTIGAAKVTEAMLKTQQLAGLHAARIAHGIYNTGAGFGTGAHTIGATIPINAFITGVWYWVKTTFTSASDAATLAISVEGANDCVSAIAISDGSNPWDTTAKPVEGIPKVETTSTFLVTTAARALTVTSAVETITAGEMHVWVQYMVYE